MFSHRSEHALLARIPLLFIVAITYRLRYYFAWAVSESSLIFSGLSYVGTDPATGRPGWDRCINARIEKVEPPLELNAQLNCDPWCRSLETCLSMPSAHPANTPDVMWRNHVTGTECTDKLLVAGRAGD